MLAELTSEQFSYWMAYNRLEPFGPLGAWQRSGQIASMIGNTHLRKGARPFTPQDFMPAKPKGEASRQSLSEMKSVLMTMVAPVAKAEKKKTNRRAPRDG